MFSNFCFRRAILQNVDLTSKAPLSNLWRNDFWGTPLSHSGSHKSFRPLTTLTFKLNHMLAGYRSGVFHFTNALLHALVTGLLVTYTKSVTSNYQVAMVTGLMFALHPIHTEAVSGIVGRADVLSAAFFLLALLSYERHVKKRGHSSTKGPISPLRDSNGNQIVKSNAFKQNKVSGRGDNYLLATAMFTGLAMFSKEQGITVLGVCLVRELLQIKHSNLSKRSLAFLICSLVSLLSLRFAAMGFKKPSFAKADNPAASHGSIIVRFLTFMYLPAFNFKLLLQPNTLSFDWSMEAIPLVQSVLDSRNIESLAFYALLLVASYKALKKMSTSQSLAIAMLTLPFLPATNLLFHVGFVVAERILYIPSIGFCWLVAQGLCKLNVVFQNQRGLRTTVKIGLLVLLSSFCLKTLARNMDWHNEEALYSSGLKLNPPKGKKTENAVQNNMVSL